LAATRRKRMKALDPDRETPIRPATIHPVPIVTIEKLATTIYWIGRTAIRARTEPCDRAMARLALIEQAAEAALED
jgi:hypothetical protein